MIVYVVAGGWDWEGSICLSVYDNRKAAVEAVAEAERTNRYDYVEIEEHTVRSNTYEEEA